MTRKEADSASHRRAIDPSPGRIHQDVYGVPHAILAPLGEVWIGARDGSGRTRIVTASEWVAPAQSVSVVWADEIDDRGLRDSTTLVLLSPGVRFAVIQEPLEWVLGVAIPVGLTRDSPDIGAVAYMSIEHPFRKLKNGE